MNSLVVDNIKRVGILGHGQMGRQAAALCLRHGYETTVYGRDEERLERAGRLITRFAKNGPAYKPNTLKCTTELPDLSQCDIILENIVEASQAKAALLALVCFQVRSNIVIATNTSSYRVSDLAKHVIDPERFIGIHFMNPPDKRPLVELIRGDQTSDDTHAVSLKFAQSLGQQTINAPDSVGSVVNLLLASMVHQAIRLLATGVSREDLDLAMKVAAGHPMGPIRLADFIGLDTLQVILSELQIRHESGFEPLPLLDELVRQGRLGSKSGKGFYDYNS